MTSLTLVPHPANEDRAITGILAVAGRIPGGVSVAFRAIGNRDAVRWPPVARQAFADGLWRHSCFEAFVMTQGEEGYVELNIAPSKRWAAYRFDDYRAGMRRAVAAPMGRLIWNRASATLMARFTLPDLPHDTAWHLGLSAVIETLGGVRSYFALAHPPGDPDFHNRDCFALRLAPPTAP